MMLTRRPASASVPHQQQQVQAQVQGQVQQVQQQAVVMPYPRSAKWWPMLWVQAASVPNCWPTLERSCRQQGVTHHPQQQQVQATPLAMQQQRPWVVQVQVQQVVVPPHTPPASHAAAVTGAVTRVL
jgi:hypothetical protein